MFYYNVKSQTSWLAAPFIAFVVMVVGLLIGVATPGIAAKITAGLNRDLSEAEGKNLAASTGHGQQPFPTTEV